MRLSKDEPDFSDFRSLAAYYHCGVVICLNLLDSTSYFRVKISDFSDFCSFAAYYHSCVVIYSILPCVSEY